VTVFVFVLVFVLVAVLVAVLVSDDRGPDHTISNG
jgi:hypothetical protein